MFSAPYIIAEAGTCHAAGENMIQKMDIACMHVEAAANAGADAVKFQWFNTPIKDDMFCWIDGDEARSGRWEESYIPLDCWMLIKEVADDVGIDFLASAFQHSTVAWLNELGLKATKVASRAAATFPYDDAPEPFLISNGMSDFVPVNKSFHRFQCEANYPSTTWWEGKTPGFSDHSADPARAVDAMHRGAKLIEVHFYIDPEFAGPDLPASLSPSQLRSICLAREEIKGMKEDNE